MKSQIVYEKTASLSHVEDVAKDILARLPQNAIIFLEGNLAAGKTTLVSKIVSLLNLGGATSPTFSLQQVYGDKLFHYDFYRSNFEELLALGLLNEFEKEGLHFIEWPSSELKALLLDAGFNIFLIEITPINSDKRKYTLKVFDA